MLGTSDLSCSWNFVQPLIFNANETVASHWYAWNFRTNAAAYEIYENKKAYEIIWICIIIMTWSARILHVNVFLLPIFSCRGKEVLQATLLRSPNITDVISGKLTACQVSDRAPLALIYLGFFAQIAIGIAAGVWGINRSSAKSWKKFLKR